MKICGFILCFVLKGVLSDDVKSLMEGYSVTLNVEIPNIQIYELILWTFGPDSTRIAQINKAAMKISLYDDVLDGRFRDRLTLDEQTGSLTITNITTEHTGLYELQVFGVNSISKKFSVIVYARLPVPVITRNSPQCSSCWVLCSVVNVSHVTLSWLKGHSLLSSISVSDLSISLSLPLEVEDQDTNNYSCVLNNSITHRTTHLDISAVCHTCGVDASHTEKSLPLHHVVLICIGIAVVLIILAVVGMISIYLKYKKKCKPKQAGQTSQHEYTEVNNADALTEKDELKMVSVSVGKSVTLNTGVTKIKSFDVLQWRFGELNTDKTNEFVVFHRLNEPKMYNCNGHDNTLRNRVHLDKQTGYLTIENIRPTDFGIYKLIISRNKKTMISKTFLVQASSDNTDVTETALNREEDTSL